MNLENRFFYRLVKVLYGLSLGLLLLATAFYINEYAHQTLTQDNEKSYVTCQQNGKKYPLNLVGIEMYFYGPSIGATEQNIADNFCFAHQTGLIDLLATNQITVAYKMDLYSARFDFLIMLIISYLFYILLNITKESLIYVAFGKKFTLDWLFPGKQTLYKVIKLLKSNSGSSA
jgi:hypothetical protein